LRELLRREFVSIPRPAQLFERDVRLGTGQRSLDSRALTVTLGLIVFFG
jgi:hypothetical protein